jgi:hypothetical protein
MEINKDKAVPLPLCKWQGGEELQLLFFTSALDGVSGQRQWRQYGFFPPEGGVGLAPKRGCLVTLAYYAFPIWYEFGERRWNDIDRGKPKNSEKNLSQCHFVHKSHMDWPGREHGPPRRVAGD